jgi:hypothetical protein
MRGSSVKMPATVEPDTGQPSLVPFVRQLDEAPHGRLAVIIGPAWRMDHLPQKRTVRLFVNRVLAGFEGGILCRHASFARAAWPIILVVQPYLHAKPPGCLQNCSQS